LTSQSNKKPHSRPKNCLDEISQAQSVSFFERVLGFKTRNTMNKSSLVAVILTASFASGCASYRTSSNVESQPTSTADAITKVIISENSLPKHKYKALGPVEVSIKN
jgi:hypothetical protein